MNPHAQAMIDLFGLGDAVRDDAREIEVVARAVIERGRAMDILIFARNILGGTVEVPALQDEVCGRGVADVALLFARDIAWADVDRLCEAVIDSGDTTAMARFACEVDGANVEMISGALVTSMDAPAMRYVASNAPGADAERLEYEASEVERRMQDRQCRMRETM